MNPPADGSISNVNVAIGQRLRALIDKQDISIAKVAAILGMRTRQSVYDILDGTRPLKVDELLTLAMALGVPPLALLIPEDDEEPLRVLRPGGHVVLSGASGSTSAQVAYAWMAGRFDPNIVFWVNPLTFMAAMPHSVASRYVEDLAELARDEGFTVDVDEETDEGTLASRVSIPRALWNDELEAINEQVEDLRVRLRRFTQQEGSMGRLPADKQRSREAARAKIKELEQQALAIANAQIPEHHAKAQEQTKKGKR